MKTESFFSTVNNHSANFQIAYNAHCLMADIQNAYQALHQNLLYGAELLVKDQAERINALSRKKKLYGEAAFILTDGLERSVTQRTGAILKAKKEAMSHQFGGGNHLFTFADGSILEITYQSEENPLGSWRAYPSAADFDAGDYITCGVFRSI